MRRPGRPIAIVLSLLLAAACSRHDESKVSADLKHAGHAAAQDARKLAAEAKAAAHSLANDGRNAAHQAAHAGDRDS